MLAPHPHRRRASSQTRSAPATAGKDLPEPGPSTAPPAIPTPTSSESGSPRPPSKSISTFLTESPARRPPTKFALPRKRTNSLSTPLDGAVLDPQRPRPAHRHRALPMRPSTASGTPESMPRVPIVIASPFAAAPPFADFMIRRKSTKTVVRKESGTVPVASPLRAGASASSHDEPPKVEIHFSTADRTILEELKHNVAARESQFKMKGGKKHHPYSAKEAPYPRNYERLVIDHDVWEDAFCLQLAGSLTFHVFPTPPTKVLDLGCGSGSWILECAKQWRSCEFVGMDLVPLHPDLSHLRSSDLPSRITWVQANCLEGLPFPNDEFDFVHIKRISLGIPEDKWDALLEEIVRVMKPGAAIEMLEEELFFPGQAPPDESVLHIQYLPTPPQSNDDLHTTQRPAHARMEAQHVASMLTPMFATSVLPTPQPAPPISHSTSVPGLPRASQSADQVSDAPLNPRDHSLLEYIYTEMHAARFINLSPLSLLANSLPLYFTNVRTHAPIILMFPPNVVHKPKRTMQRDSSDLGSSDSDSDYEFQQTRSLVKASRDTPRPHKPKASHTRGTTDASRILNEDDVASEAPFSVIHGRTVKHHMSEYVVLDESLRSAPPPRRSGSTVDFDVHPTPAPSTVLLAWSDATGTTPEQDAVQQQLNRLPNGQLEFDLKSLNLHLSQRIVGVLACAEAMWEWVQAWQEQLRWDMVEWSEDKKAGGVAGPAKELVGMSRSEFDVLLSRFELDMHDCIGLDARITDAFHWPSPSFARTPDRKVFENACAKWDEYRAQQLHTHHRLHSRAPTMPGTAEPPPPPEQPHPAHRLSRTIRTFCAWKAS